ncbi:class I SAM-dependent methyltransferase [Methanosarcina sp. KYL-1]|uniref:class I SAM-dependent methyltransferase n=1 Tax=Methanosarcina sp. KYL-1 TaxID=2602068 RepID=UPI00210185EC|nr:class I SAM-dependent methyltransferase [Methanosarcina sp. KYL-1]MCQ1534874.1 class I SAM-dependent methyltransferase [Methanosarcina sp. KYL-1]
MSEIQRKFDAISKKYDEQRKKFIPCFDDFYGTAVSVASVDAENPSILDIGAGTGLLSAFLMERYPGASFTLIDISEKMLDVAKERFGNNSNVKYIAADYSKYDFVEKYDLVVSAVSIHHLEDEEKKELYSKSYSILKENGVFINADQVHGETPFIENLNKTTWRQRIESSGLSEEEILAGYERVKLDKDSSLAQQLDWLKEAGFCDVSCIYKYYQFAVMFGRKLDINSI